MKPTKPRTQSKRPPNGWEPYVNELTGCTWNGLFSKCCDSPAHSGSWHGKSGYMCQSCSKPCEIGRASAW